MSDLNVFTNGFAFLAFIYICLGLLGLGIIGFAVFLLYRLFKRPLENGGPLSLSITKTMIIAGLLIITHFGMVGGPNKAGAIIIGGNNYFEPQASLILFIVGIISALILQPLHRKTSQQKSA